MPDETLETASGYLAVPTGPPPGPWSGVVVIHESWGLNGDIRAHADRLAAKGYLALAPDLYRGKSFVRCFRDVFRQLHAGSGSAFDTIDAARAASSRSHRSTTARSRPTRSGCWLPARSWRASAAGTRWAPSRLSGWTTR